MTGTTDDVKGGQLPVTMHRNIVEFLTFIPGLHENNALRAFLNNVGLDWQLQKQIRFDVSLEQFFQLLIPILFEYGTLEDGRHALRTVLESAKEYVGQEKREQCQRLIQDLDAILLKTDGQIPQLTDLLNTTKTASNVHILLVDDNVKHLERCEKWLRKFDYTEIECARSAKEAHEQLAHRAYDIIIADMRMEDGDSGFAVIEEVNKRKISSVVIILTANDTVAGCRKAFKMGVWDYLSKNMEENIFEVLNQSIQDAIAYFNSLGNVKDKQWIRENMGYLLDHYYGQYVAVLNNRVVISAETEVDVKQQILLQKLPLFLTVEKVDYELFKELPEHLLVVFVEGPTDVTYLRTALKIFGRNDLLKTIVIDTIGSRLGTSGSGHPGLKGGFGFLKENRLITNKVLFLFDPDVKEADLPNKGQDEENLHIRRMQEYSAEHRGIEFFFGADIFEEGVSKGIVRKTITTRITGEQQESRTDYLVTHKIEFCQWICQHRNRPEDFEGFQDIIRIIDDIVQTQATSVI